MMTGLIAKNISEVPFSQRVIALTLVLAVHGGAFLVWAMLPVRADSQPKPISVYVLLENESPQPKDQPFPIEEISSVAPQPKIEVIKTKTATSALDTNDRILPSSVKTTLSVAAAASSAVSLPASNIVVQQNSEPNYRASHLNNMPPNYPMVARRMGWQGKVILNIEVLDDGCPGEIDVFRSSNYSVLDKAAINAVTKWRFIPAQRAGIVVTQWFQVPVNFVLKQL